MVLSLLNMPGILIVDDSRSHRDNLRRIYQSAGYHVAGEAACGTEAIASFQKQKPSLVTLDLILPDMNGVDLLRTMKTTDPMIPILVCTTFWHDIVTDLVCREGALALIPKPVKEEQLLAYTAEALGFTHHPISEVGTCSAD